MSCNVLRAWLATHCGCCGADAPADKWARVAWTELTMVLPDHPNAPAWQCPECHRRVLRIAAGVDALRRESAG